MIVKRCNTLVTVQDAGRFGFQAQGVPVSGAMDGDSLFSANLLVGNKPEAACLEILSGSLELYFNECCTLAFTGGGCWATCNGIELPFNKRLQLPANAWVKLAATSKGLWTYLAVHGGFDVRMELGSRSTYLPASLSGLGRSLQTGDSLELLRCDDLKHTEKEIVIMNSWGIPKAENAEFIRVIYGPDFERLTAQAKKDLVELCFTISPDSNRIGYRLTGKRLEVNHVEELISTPVSCGTVQLSNEGLPMILMADAQTIGGYPRIAQVAAVDIPVLAQKRPGESIHFTFISYDEACRLKLLRDQHRVKTEIAIRFKLRENVC